MEIIQPIAALTSELSKLPGIGRKTAQRLAFHIIGMSGEDVSALAQAIHYAKANTKFCTACGNITDIDPCALCTDFSRKTDVLCVVSSARDVFAIERTHSFRGRYHVLGGSISPMDGIGPDDLRINELIARLDGVKEVIMATNADIEGEATAAYIGGLIKPRGIIVTRIAQGMPMGANLEYADDMTLSIALNARREM